MFICLSVCLLNCLSVYVCILEQVLVQQLLESVLFWILSRLFFPWSLPPPPPHPSTASLPLTPLLPHPQHSSLSPSLSHNNVFLCVSPSPSFSPSLPASLPPSPPPSLPPSSRTAYDRRAELATKRLTDATPKSSDSATSPTSTASAVATLAIDIPSTGKESQISQLGRSVARRAVARRVAPKLLRVIRIENLRKISEKSTLKSLYI